MTRVRKRDRRIVRFKVELVWSWDFLNMGCKGSGSIKIVWGFLVSLDRLENVG